MKKYLLVIGVFLVVLLVLTGCAEAVAIELPPEEESPYGFFSGIWHGLVMPFALVGSLFSENIAIYGAHNIGWLYDLGFVFGLMGWGFLGS